MIKINLEQVCFSLNNNCNKNCNDCYVDCSAHNTKSVSIEDISLFLDFIIANNESTNNEVSIDFMGGEMSEYPDLDKLATILKQKLGQFKITDMRVTTYAEESKNLEDFVSSMIDVVDRVRYFIIRDLKNGLDYNTIKYVENVSNIDKKVSPTVEHVLRPVDIHQFHKLLKLAYENEFISLDICYPCGDKDFTKDQLEQLCEIYRDFLVKTNYNEASNITSFGVRSSMFPIEDIHHVLIRMQRDNKESHCKPFTSEIWLSPSGNIFPCAHMIKYDSYFEYNNIRILTLDKTKYFSNKLNNLFNVDINDVECCECSMKDFCLQCKILPEIVDLKNLNNVNKPTDKCRRVYDHVKSYIEVIYYDN